MMESHENAEMLKIYAGWHKKSVVRNGCASGGIFFAIAKQIVMMGGVAIGAAYDENLNVRHIIAENMEQLERLKSSKYVQSTLGDIFPKVKNLLDHGKQVVFSGTPCQTEALRRYCGWHPSLLVCSLFCYGTPMPAVFVGYKQYLEESQHSEIRSINFKDKRYGWDCYATNITFKNGKSICRYGADSYKYLMQKGYSLMPSCLDCGFDYLTTGADLILGDFYNFSKCCHGKKAPHNGVSVVVVKSEKGELCLHNAKDLTLIPVNCDTFEEYEKPKNRAFDKEKRDAFLNIFEQKGYREACEAVGLNDSRLSLKVRLLALRKRLRL